MSTYSQVYIQIVFAVKRRNCLIDYSWEEKLYKYITGIVQNKGQKMLAINGMPDHIHIFIDMKPNCNLSDVVREIKKCSNTYINENKFCKQKFSWQEGFGVFSYNHRQVKKIINYILNQKTHHENKKFKEEFINHLHENEIKYDEKYLFDWIF